MVTSFLQLESSTDTLEFESSDSNLLLESSGQAVYWHNLLGDSDGNNLANYTADALGTTPATTLAIRPVDDTHDLRFDGTGLGSTDPATFDTTATVNSLFRATAGGSELTIAGAVTLTLNTDSSYASGLILAAGATLSAIANMTLGNAGLVSGTGTLQAAGGTVVAINSGILAVPLRCTGSCTIARTGGGLTVQVDDVEVGDTLILQSTTPGVLYLPNAIVALHLDGNAADGEIHIGASTLTDVALTTVRSNTLFRNATLSGVARLGGQLTTEVGTTIDFNGNDLEVQFANFHLGTAVVAAPGSALILYSAGAPAQLAAPTAQLPEVHNRAADGLILLTDVAATYYIQVHVGTGELDTAGRTMTIEHNTSLLSGSVNLDNLPGTVFTNTTGFFQVMGMHMNPIGVWFVNSTLTPTASMSIMALSDANGGATGNAVDATDAGGNLNWDFGVPLGGPAGGRIMGLGLGLRLIKA